MKTIEEIRDWLLENAVDDLGDLYLSELDLSNFNGNVYIDCMKVKKSLFQSCQEVGEDLYQENQEVGGDFYNHKLKDGEYWKEEATYVVRRKEVKEITLEELEKMGFKLKGEK